jgi:hypothetical protein
MLRIGNGNFSFGLLKGTIYQDYKNGMMRKIWIESSHGNQHGAWVILFGNNSTYSLTYFIWIELSRPKEDNVSNDEHAVPRVLICSHSISDVACAGNLQATSENVNLYS